MLCISAVGLLLANVTSSNLRRVSNPDLVTEPLGQVQKPLAVAYGFYTNQGRTRELSIKLLGLAIGMHQLMLCYLPGFCIHHHHLLKHWMKIATYNYHRCSFLPKLILVGQA